MSEIASKVQNQKLFQQLASPTIWVQTHWIL